MNLETQSQWCGGTWDESRPGTKSAVLKISRAQVKIICTARKQNPNHQYVQMQNGMDLSKMSITASAITKYSIICVPY